MGLTTVLGAFGRASEAAPPREALAVCCVAERLTRAVAGSLLVFAGFLVSSPPSNKSGALGLRLVRVWEDIGVHNRWNSSFVLELIFFV